MASVKPKFRPSSVEGKEGSIYYQVIHGRTVRHIATRLRILPEEWDEKALYVRPSQSEPRNQHIKNVRRTMTHDIERLSRIVGALEDECLPYTADDIVNEFKRRCSEFTLFNYMSGLIAGLKQEGRIRTAETYTAALKSFSKFRHDEDIMLDSITSGDMEAYERWSRQRGLQPNSISFYTRILRAVYNRAVDNDIIADRRPFRHVYTGIDKTVKRALPLNTVKRIKNLNLASNPALDYARDMFIMSFMLRGMSLIDMAYLRKSDLTHGYITYRRRKTGQQLTIKWTVEMQQIMDKYPPNASEYLLPIIRRQGCHDRGVYRNAGYTINRRLKTIATMLDIPIPLTLYVARHSWASAARSKGIPLSVISEGMGHDSEKTTRIYLAALDTSTIDKANSLILRAL